MPPNALLIERIESKGGIDGEVADVISARLKPEQQNGPPADEFRQVAGGPGEADKPG
jgi:hypothetical protein